MSVAVAQMPHLVSPVETAAAADAPGDLLEALLAACQKPASATPLPGFGRELTPYFSPADAVGLGAQPKRTGSPPKKNHRKAAASVTAAAIIAAAKKTAVQQPAVARPAPKNATPTEVEKARAVKMASLISSWAGPGFCVAPTPEKLPMPTPRLLG